MSHDTRPNQYRDQRESQREKHGPKFDFAEFPGHYVVYYKGQYLVQISKDPNELPGGFTRRLAAHVMDLVTGRRSALWDEHAIYGEHDRDPAHARINGGRVADAMAERREAAKDDKAQ